MGAVTVSRPDCPLRLMGPWRRAIHQDYLKLRQAAQQAGNWADLNGWALDLLRDRAHAEQWYVRELISVLVSENLLDEAWVAAMADPGQVSESKWFQPIEVREQDHHQARRGAGPPLGGPAAR